jgi:hypothetical protein
MKPITLLITLLLTSIACATTGSTPPPSTTIELIFFQHDLDSQATPPERPLSLVPASPSTVYSYHSLEGMYLAQTITHILENTRVSGPECGEQVTHALLASYHGLMDPYNTWQHTNTYQLQAENTKQLEAIKAKLRASQLNQVLFHMAWTLPHDDQTSTLPFVFDSKTLSNEDISTQLGQEIQGKIRVSGSKNWDFNAEITLVNQETPYVLTFARRMKKNQLNYIDNERYGLLVMISNPTHHEANW